MYYDIMEDQKLSYDSCDFENTDLENRALYWLISKRLPSSLTELLCISHPELTWVKPAKVYNCIVWAQRLGLIVSIGDKYRLSQTSEVIQANQ